MDGSNSPCARVGCGCYGVQGLGVLVQSVAAKLWGWGDARDQLGWCSMRMQC